MFNFRSFRPDACRAVLGKETSDVCACARGLICRVEILHDVVQVKPRGVSEFG